MLSSSENAEDAARSVEVSRLSLWLALTVGIAISAVLLRARLNYVGLPKIPHVAAGSDFPDCMVLIPARDEESQIARAVRSFPHDTVIVVDDASTDATRERAREAGAGVLSAPPVAGAARGKPTALLAGANALTSRWILFADADTWYEPDFLNSIVEYARQASLDFLSLHLEAAGDGFWESLFAPYAHAMLYTGVGPGRAPEALINGQCLLVRREAYEFIGGHSTVVSNRIEDVPLATRVRRHRLKFGVARSGTMGHARLGNGLFGMWRAFERNAARFLLVSSWIGPSIIVASLVMALWIPSAVWLWVDHQHAAAAGMALLPAVLLSVWYPGWLRAVLAPFAVYLFLPMAANAVLAALSGRRVRWKGRTV